MKNFFISAFFVYVFFLSFEQVTSSTPNETHTSINHIVKSKSKNKDSRNHFLIGAALGIGVCISCYGGLYYYASLSNNKQAQHVNSPEKIKSINGIEELNNKKKLLQVEHNQKLKELYKKANELSTEIQSKSNKSKKSLLKKEKQKIEYIIKHEQKINDLKIRDINHQLELNRLETEITFRKNSSSEDAEADLIRLLNQKIKCENDYMLYVQDGELYLQELQALISDTPFCYDKKIQIARQRDDIRIKRGEKPIFLNRTLEHFVNEASLYPEEKQEGKCE